jgi:DNA-binding Lrp family transcriptional regulator
VDAYILIHAEVGKGAQVARSVAAIKGVSTAELVTGPYDVLARAEGTSLDDLTRSVTVKIQEIDGVVRTLTCPIVHL